MRLNHVRRDPRGWWDKLWRDRQGRVVIFQQPNIWLMIWIVLTCLSLFTSSRSIANDTWWLSSGALVIWALLEIFKGVNYFRRLLGLVIFCMTVASAFGVGL